MSDDTNTTSREEPTIMPGEETQYAITPDERADLDNWFSYHAPTPETIPVFEAIRDAGHDMAEKVMALVPPSPDRTVAIRHIRDAVMNANAALACYPEGFPRS